MFGGELAQGGTLRFWGDKWLSQPVTFRVQSPRMAFDYNGPVDFLREELSGQWKLDEIRCVVRTKRVVTSGRGRIHSSIPAHLTQR